MEENKLIGRKCWFQVGVGYNKVGIIIDIWYDGLLLIEELEKKKVHVSSENEIELIKPKI